MIYTKPINLITYDDVVKFCEGDIAEGMTLDYKEEITSKGIAKAIAAFANTWGGTIVIGVGDKDGKPLPPFVGMPYHKGMQEQIIQISLTNITPPIVPDVQICTNNDNTKSFAIVRVHQSNITPHALVNNTQVYCRTGSLSTPHEEAASIEKIAWLMDRKKKSEHLKKSLCEDSIKYFKRLSSSDEVEFPLLKFTAVPSYPFDLLTTPESLYQTVRSLNLFITEYSIEMPPLMRGQLSNHITAIPGGVVAYNKGDCLILNELGLLQVVDPIGFDRTIQARFDPDGDKIIDFMRVLWKVDLFTKLIIKFFKSVGYWGLCDITIEMLGIPDDAYVIGLEHRDFTPQTVNPLINDHVKTYTYSVSELEANRRLIVTKIIKEYGWGLGLNELTDDLIDSFLSQDGDVFLGSPKR